jgi:predicted metalloprotease with PDZ domain
MFRCRIALAALLSSSAALSQSTSPIKLRIDLSDAPRHLIHVTEVLPVHTGENSFSYPEWIPGRHRPSGPIDNVTGIVFHLERVDGPVTPWRRDLTDLYSFHVQAPTGTHFIAVTFDILDEPSRKNGFPTRMMSSHVAMLEPSFAVLYPSGEAVREIPVTATVHLPAGWSSATALQTADQTTPTLHGQDTTFATVSMERFVDSPIVAGDHCRQYLLATEISPVHTLDLCAEKAADLELPTDLLKDISNLVRQAKLIFKSYHYDHYDFLVAASPHISGEQTEHAQSAAVEASSPDIKDLPMFLQQALSHEFTHSWNGKYRRPTGMATAEYHTPQQDDLLWVYEGLTQYYGYVLEARAGFRTPQEAIESLLVEIYKQDGPGRRWRPLQDTADSLPILRDAEPAWSSWRRSTDYYREGAFLWLEADVKIRQLS